MSFRKYEIPKGFKKLPSSVTIKILSYLRPKDLCEIAQVCKWFCYYSSSDELWEKHCKNILDCKFQDDELSVPWKVHFLHILHGLRYLGPQSIHTIGIEEIVIIKKNSPKHFIERISNSSSSKQVDKIQVWEERVICLLDHGMVNINFRKPCYDIEAQEEFFSFLHWATAFGSSLLVRWIVERGGGIIFGKKNIDYNPLHLASYLGKKDIVDYLLCWVEGDSDIWKTQIEVTRKFVETKNVSQHFDNSATPGSWEAFSEIIEMEDSKGKTALILACSKGNYECAQILLKHGADPNHKSSNTSLSPLHFAVANGSRRIISLLIEQYEADYYALTNKGRNILHEAARFGRVKTIKYLVEQLKMDVNETTSDDDGCTPLHLACRYGRLAAAKQLISLGADINATTVYGTTIFQEASTNGHQSVLAWLKQYNNQGRITSRNNTIENTLSSAGKSIDESVGCTIS
eukprot:TRINITY_DN13780_c0_g1_i1.p1 TRINITY_DN13780_c0_g1~~TRINITY_DN13780_c0_g1_i1.p1  ORF type:complete len:460 (+),score=129.98 TRINITY_DN13780_c0_g1_i1:33-1412(+)